MPRVEAGFSDSEKALATDLLTNLGPSVNVHVGFDPKYSPEAGNNPSVGDFRVVSALVDTGAVMSCIDSDLAYELGLAVVDRQKCSGVGGIEELNLHLAQMYIPALGTVHGRLMGARMAQGNQPHRAILGRSFLQYHVMIYDGSVGRVSILR